MAALSHVRLGVPCSEVDIRWDLAQMQAELPAEVAFKKVNDPMWRHHNAKQLHGCDIGCGDQASIDVQVVYDAKGLEPSTCPSRKVAGECDRRCRVADDIEKFFEIH